MRNWFKCKSETSDAPDTSPEAAVELRKAKTQAAAVRRKWPRVNFISDTAARELEVNNFAARFQMLKGGA